MAAVDARFSTNTCVDGRTAAWPLEIAVPLVAVVVLEFLPREESTAVLGNLVRCVVVPLDVQDALLSDDFASEFSTGAGGLAGGLAGEVAPLALREASLLTAKLAIICSTFSAPPRREAVPLSSGHSQAWSTSSRAVILSAGSS